MTFTLRCTAFGDGAPIPAQFTCDGANVEPPLHWSGAPEGTRSFALILDDPDAPGGTFTHWLLYDVPASATAVNGEGASLRNDFGRDGYGGPCPPRGHGSHRYVFTLYAVNVPSLTLRGRTRTSLEHALRDHTLGVARLVGLYERRR